MNTIIGTTDVVVCAIGSLIGIYYLWQNRDNTSRLRTAMVLLLGTFACDTLFSTYQLLSHGPQRSVTILGLHAVCAGIFYLLAYSPNRCEYPAVHHLNSVRRCVVVKKNRTPQHQVVT